MNAREVLDACIRSSVLPKRVEENIVLTSFFPDICPLSDQLIELVKSHKQELLALLGWQEEADALLLESTQRLAAAWPAGCPLEGPEWEAHEKALFDAYQSGDTHTLNVALSRREACAGSVFAHYQQRVKP